MFEDLNTKVHLQSDRLIIGIPRAVAHFSTLACIINAKRLCAYSITFKVTSFVINLFIFITIQNQRLLKMSFVISSQLEWVGGVQIFNPSNLPFHPCEIARLPC